jgi:hypothetical protein
MKRWQILAMSSVLCACAQNPPSPTYAQKVAAIPPPANESERQQKCGALRSEIARQQNFAMYAASQMQGMYSVAGQMSARNNIAALESRASDFQCSAAFGQGPSQSIIDSCVRSCKENTSRSPDQCFDACNH